MDVLGHLITKASSVSLLLPLTSRGLQHHISIYADDVALFLRPVAGDINMTMDILNLFGEASRLKTNLQKSNVLPIKCDNLEIATIKLATLPTLDIPMQILRSASLYKKTN